MQPVVSGLGKNKHEAAPENINQLPLCPTKRGNGDEGAHVWPGATGPLVARPRPRSPGCGRAAGGGGAPLAESAAATHRHRQHGLGA
jgi:hypothetical protein